MVYDVMFMVQHYVLYGEKKEEMEEEGEGDADRPTSERQAMFADSAKPKVLYA